MKRYGNLYGQICDPGNLMKAHIKARRGKSHYTAVKQVNADPEKYLTEIRHMLLEKTFRTSPYVVKTIFEPKKRVIYKLPYLPDRIVHHAIMNVLQPIWDRMLIDDVYSAIPGRGLHAGLLRLRKFLKNKDDTQYCLKFDISHFYPSVDHDILLALIKRRIKCEDTVWLLEEIIRSPGGNKNIPIGNYLSQYFAQIYLDPLDRWLKEEKKARYYIRYGDDGVILHSDRQFLKGLLVEISEYMRDELQLTINPKSRVIPVDTAGIDFLGYRTYRTHALLRKRSAERFKARIQCIEKSYQHTDPQTVISSIMSYVGWIDFCDGYNLKNKYIISNNKLQLVMDLASNKLGIDNPLIKRGYYDRSKQCSEDMV
jgi:RNA-directed DNA polymerase